MEEERGLMFPDWQLPYFCRARTGVAGNTARASGSGGKSNSRAASRIDKASRARNGTIRNARRFRYSVRNQDREARFFPLHAGPIRGCLSRNRKGRAQLSFAYRTSTLRKREADVCSEPVGRRRP